MVSVNLHIILIWITGTLIVSAILFYLLITKSVKLIQLKKDIQLIEDRHIEEMKLSQYSIDHAADFIFWTNRYSEILFFNSSVTEKLKYQIEEINNYKITNIFQELQPEKWNEYWKKLTECGNYIFESSITAYNEKLIPVEVHSKYYVYEGVELNFIFARDISTRKAIEAKLLEEKNKAQKSERLKSAFLANISHEIRTPMNAIIGFSDLLSDPDLTPDQRKEIINQIKFNSESLLGLLDDIIDISMIEANDLKLNLNRHNLNQILLSIYDFYKEHKCNYTADNVGFTIKIYEKLNSVNIITDIGRFRQIFSNLIKNAFKFTTSGYIEFGYHISQDKGIVFFVKDTGIGIPKKKQKDVFSNFTKFGDSIEKLYQGTGLGLAITKRIIELLGGTIWFESEPDKGSIFYFTLPIENLNVSIETSILKTTNEKRWDNKKILVVEDLDYNFELIEAALRNTKVNVIRAKDGKEAIDIYKNNENIDVILMDIRMPVMNGYEATREIKKINHRIPIIAQTAYAFGEEKELCYRAGCDDFISKPINKGLLIELIDKHLSS